MAELILYDPDPDPGKKKRKKRKATPAQLRALAKARAVLQAKRKAESSSGKWIEIGDIRGKKYGVGKRGGVAWIGGKKPRYDPDPDPGVPRRFRRFRGLLTALAGICSYIYANVRKDATSINDVPAKLIEHHTKPTQYLPKSIGEYWDRLKSNPVFWAGIVAWVYSLLPIRRLPARKTVGNIGKAVTLGTALGAILDPEKNSPSLATPQHGGSINKPMQPLEVRL